LSIVSASESAAAGANWIKFNPPGAPIFRDNFLRHSLVIDERKRRKYAHHRKDNYKEDFHCDSVNIDLTIT
jgi:hypothetical protein